MVRLRKRFQATVDDKDGIASEAGCSPETEIPINWKIDDSERIHIDFVYCGVKSTCDLSAHDHSAYEEFEIGGENVSWSQYKAEVSQLERYSHIFRGQGGIWPIRSSLYRKGGYSIKEYSENIITKVKKEIEIFLDREFNLKDEEDFLNFCSLLQHHRFPTPIIDWTYSPYIAAFFAMQRQPEGEYAQVFVLDHKRIDEWFEVADVTQNGDLRYQAVSLKVGDFAMMPNPRHLPQQSISLAANIDMLTGYFEFVEEHSKKKIFRTYNLHRDERPLILSELSSMGITAASLFPGLDGVCEALRGKLFGDYSELPRKRISDDPI